VAVKWKNININGRYDRVFGARYLDGVSQGRSPVESRREGGHDPLRLGSMLVLRADLQGDEETTQFVPNNREEEKQHQITVLQSVSDAISRFCVAHGQPATELEEGHQATMPLVGELKTDSDEGHAATELDTEDDSMDSEEKEQESSDS
jgi:hypothetical protein